MHEYLSDPPVCFPPQLHNAANANQKEKYEADLKKEIKKLQVKAERKTLLLPQNDPFSFLLHGSTVNEEWEKRERSS